MDLATPIGHLNRVGKIAEKRLAMLGLKTARDLLFYFPFRYEDFSRVVAIRDLRPNESVTIKGKIELIAAKRSPRKRTIITEAVVSDATGSVRVVWFGQPFIAKVLQTGDTIYISGEAKIDRFGLSFVGPEYEKERPPLSYFSPGRGGGGVVTGKNTELSSNNTSPYIPPTRGESIIATTHTARIVPIYSVTQGLTQKQIRFLVSQVIDLAGTVADWLPEDIRQRASVVALAMALRDIHFPATLEQLTRAERRLKFDELFVVQLRAELIRQAVRQARAPLLNFYEAETKEFVARLPWTLTKTQKIAAWEILQDMGKNQPMNRLLEGDVGSGKTVVAALAMHNAVLNGYQAVLLAPTEILARQHYESLCALFQQHSLRIALFTRSQKIINDSLDEKNFMDHVSAINVIVGTHALLSEKFTFQNLGLVIVDEQHRFGVEQRKLIRAKAGLRDDAIPHFLSMTATPIPRSLALTLYGDLDVSVISEMPPGRKRVLTRVEAPHHREKAYQFIREQVKRGRQCFVICPLIESTDADQPPHQPSRLGAPPFQGGASMGDEKKSVLNEYKKLSEKIFPDLRVGFLHGKLKSKEKEDVMAQFASGTIDIMVSTSVVEVGVNIPNASVMMIEGAERFGLAQLHQFRGRVGRSDHQSYCFLFPQEYSEKIDNRLAYFAVNTDGFKLAEYDLQERGPGEVYGTAQSGMMNFKLATLHDVALIRLARELARDLDLTRYPSLRDMVNLWEEEVHLE